jgi:DNA-binding MarR family transcriptional regulator
VTPSPTKEQRELTLRALSLLRRVGAAAQDWQRSSILHGFTINQALVLHHLVKHGDATPSMLADWMQVTRGSVTPTIQHLEGMGLVERRADAEDGRRQWLAATPKARTVTDDVERQVLRPALSVFAQWPRDDLERFCRGMEQVLASPPFGGRR